MATTAIDQRTRLYGRDLLAEVAANLIRNMVGPELLSLTEPMDRWRDSLVNDVDPEPAPTTNREEAVNWTPYRDTAGNVSEETRDFEVSKAEALIELGSAIVAASVPEPTDRDLDHLKRCIVQFGVRIQDAYASLAE